jgi:hypothetical protein
VIAIEIPGVRKYLDPHSIATTPHNAQPRPQLLFPFKPVIARFSLDFGCKIARKQILRIL